jgi:predicted MFS family arabinose efflux permease
MPSSYTQPWPKAGSGEALIVLALALAPAIGLGITRFAYALLLPDMRAGLGWSYAAAGWMNTSNALGYFLGAVLASRLIARSGAFTVMASGTAACVASLGLCAGFVDFWGLNAARFVAGLGGSFSFVAGGVLAAHVAHRHPNRGAFLLALFYAGPGLGIFLSGVSVPLLLSWEGARTWQNAWGALALLSLLLSLGLILVRGYEDQKSEDRRQAAPLTRMIPLLSGYFLFGAGYIAYMTFMIAWVQDGGHGAFVQAQFWSLIGLAGMASPWLWSGVLGSQRHGRAFSLLTVVTAVGAVLPLVSSSMLALMVSAVVFGSAFFAVVAATTAFVRRNLSRPAWASAIGALTVAFGVGQTIGPVAIGALTDLTGTLSGGLWASVGLLVLGAALGAIQRDFV